MCSYPSPLAYSAAGWVVAILGESKQLYIYVLLPPRVPPFPERNSWIRPAYGWCGPPNFISFFSLFQGCPGLMSVPWSICSFFCLCMWCLEYFFPRCVEMLLAFFPFLMLVSMFLQRMRLLGWCTGYILSFSGIMECFMWATDPGGAWIHAWEESRILIIKQRGKESFLWGNKLLFCILY